MNILFLGSFYLPSHLLHISCNRYVGNANDLLQKAYIKGFSLLCDSGSKDRLIALTSPSVPAYPKRGSNIFQKSITEKMYNTNCISASFLNLPLIKHLSRFYLLRRVLRNILENIKMIDCLVVYDLDFPLLFLSKFLKKISPKSHIVCIVPDLIGFTGSPNNFLYNLYHNFCKKMLFSCYPSIDLFVYLTEEMHAFMQLPNEYVVIEGIYNDDYDEIFLQTESLLSQKKQILYAGAMTKRNGVSLLLDAFSMITEKDYELVLCGDGDLRDTIISRREKDSRIRFMGNISHLDVLKLQKTADLLVNPRPPIEEFTKYSFPSKTLEYFASATPVMMFELPGIPHEYYEYCYIFASFEKEVMMRQIVDFFDIPVSVRKTKGMNARSFILANKSSIVQINRLFSQLFK